MITIVVNVNNMAENDVNLKSGNSVINYIKNLFSIPNIPQTKVLVDSYSLAFLGGAKPGLSPKKIASNIINRKSEAGLPSGPLAGGSIAPDEVMELIRMEEIVKALTEDMRIDVCSRPGAQIQGTGGNAGGPVQVFGTILTTSCGHGQVF